MNDAAIYKSTTYFSINFSSDSASLSPATLPAAFTTSSTPSIAMRLNSVMSGLALLIVASICFIHFSGIPGSSARMNTVCIITLGLVQIDEFDSSSNL